MGSRRTPGRLVAWWRCGVVALLATSLIVDLGHANAATQAAASGAAQIPTAPIRSPIGSGEPGAVAVPPAPLRLTSAGLRPLSRQEADRLRAGRTSFGASCDIDFDDDAAIALLPDGALTTFAYAPWWNQLCNGRYARVYPTDTDHLHLGYIDTTIDVCINADNPYDTPLGAFSRGEDCEPFDPVTEPRSWINVGHYAHLHGRLELIDSYGSDYTARPFTLERMRIRSAPARVCYRMPANGPWIAAAPVGPFDEPGLVYCWSSLTPGLWDLSEWTVGAVGVDFTGATDSLPGYDDFRLS